MSLTEMSRRTFLALGGLSSLAFAWRRARPPRPAASTAVVDLAKMRATTARVDLATVVVFSVKSVKVWNGTAWISA